MSKNILRTLGFVLGMLVVSHVVFASTTDSFGLGSTIDRLQGFLTGMGGKLIGITSLIVGVVSTTIKFNPYVFLGSLGTCLVCLAGPAAINTLFTLTI